MKNAQFAGSPINIIVNVILDLGGQFSLAQEDGDTCQCSMVVMMNWVGSRLITHSEG